jgi:hypothetical protein
MTGISIEGRGAVRDGTRHICDVSYALTLHDQAEDAFTGTDGVLTLHGTPESIAASQEVLQPYDELTLVLEEPLPDGHGELPIRIEPYGGHRPDERYQISVIQ